MKLTAKRRAGHHACPVEGCTTAVPDRRLMCVAHWRRVPRALAAELFESWRDVCAGEPTSALRYRMARDAAVAAVDEKLKAAP